LSSTTLGVTVILTTAMPCTNMIKSSTKATAQVTSSYSLIDGVAWP